MSTIYTTKVLEVKEAYQGLGIPMIPDTVLIRSAWKKKVITCHPDKARSEREKEKFHEEFLKFTRFRDICLDTLDLVDRKKELDESDFYGRVVTDEEEKKKRKTKQNEEEWLEFVKDQNAFFNLREASITSLDSFIRLVFFSIFFAVGSSILLLLSLTALLGLFTSHVSFPVTVWVGGFVFFVWVFLLLKDYNEKVERYTLDSLSKTGYPFRAFLSLWGIINIFVGSLYFLWGKETLYALLFGNLGFWFLFHNLHHRLIEIEEALEKLRSIGKAMEEQFEEDTNSNSNH
jgi:hypothetical protein